MFVISLKVAFEIIGNNKKCAIGFPTPKEVWTHFVLTYRTIEDPNSIGVFVNGEEVRNPEFKGCSYGNFVEENFRQISVGQYGQLPEAAFDELIVWYRNLSRGEINTLYNYYKGTIYITVYLSLRRFE